MMAAKKPPVLPPALNQRQCQYLLAAYTLDQQLAVEHKNDYHRGSITPAREWRGMPYGRWQHFLTKPPTRLRALIEQEQQEKKQRLVDPGTGSTWKALVARGLVEVEERVVVPGLEGYSLPHILLTLKGRKLVRQLTKEVRPKAPSRTPKPSPPEGLLPAQQWLALAKLYELDDEGLPADDKRCLSFSRISYSIMWLLREQGFAIGSPDEQVHAEKYTITEQGRAFYYTYYRTN
ncbi:MAG: hypothetical protein M3Y54_02300 [Bacteroidota bacterium]|nr:hypothetical protein [Bacteroidota bacterium]